MFISGLWTTYGESFIFMVAGCLLSFIIKWAMVLIKFLYMVCFNKDKSVFIGKWYTYHYTAEHSKLIFRREIWDIQLKLTGYYATTKDEERQGLVYEGKLNIASDSSLVFVMKGKGSTEEYYIKINYPIPNSDGITYAIKVGVDFDSNKFSTIYLFSRNDLNKEEAQTKIMDKLKKTKRHFIRI
jgi:hypothetical protein